MLKPVSHLLIAGIATVLFIGLLTAGTAAIGAQEKAEKQTAKKDEKKQKEKAEKDKKKEKDDKKKGKSEQADTKQEREYLKIRKFSYEEYEKNPSFKEEVEAAYRLRQSQHNEYAYVINTRDADDEQITRTGDKLKVEDTLYDNPLVQDYINRLGQSLVPGDSKNRYAFKVLLKPIPEARSLSTGTVYISSGMISLVDNEAQLAYILAHEIAHVEKEHWRQDAMIGCGLRRYNENQANNREAMKALFGTLGGLMAKNPTEALQFQQFMQTVVPSLAKWFAPDAVISWDKSQEDEADQMGLRYLLDRRYDPREVPKFFLAVRQASLNEPRSALGFVGDGGRVVERDDQVKQFINTNQMAGPLFFGTVSHDSTWQREDVGKSMEPMRDPNGRAAATKRTISGPMEAEIKERLKNGGLIGSEREFSTVMAELKRDNGVRAYYYDMFQMALANLEESLNIKSNDPYTHFYYAKVLKLTARNPAEKTRALSEFQKAIALDKRGVLAEPHLHFALAMIEENSAPMPEVARSFKRYVEVYQKTHGGGLPPNMDVIYAYLQEADDLEWSATPATNVSMKESDTARAVVPVPPPTSAAQVEPAAVAQPQPKAEPAKQVQPKPAEKKTGSKGGKP